jgi:heme-degrading monooxygenase HmoA
MAMLELRELDEQVSVRDQLGDESEEPAVLVNIFHVAPEQLEALLSAWADDARYFKAQPGFISTQLHKGIAGSSTFLNYAVWESVSAFRAAFASPTFQSKLANYPDGATGSPHLFRKMAVAGLCVA